MSILPALNSQLDFIRSFYSTAAPPFEALLRKYLPRYESCDEEADQFEQWQAAKKGLEVLGQCSLSLVAKAMQDYLREFLRREASGDGPKKTAKESWFDNYCRRLEEGTSFRWGNSPVSRDQIEQISLCRNDFMHDPDIDGTQPTQSGRHFEKYPRSRFDDRRRRAVVKAVAQEDGEEPPNAPGSLTVTRQELLCAIADASQFCAFVESQKLKPHDARH